MSLTPWYKVVTPREDLRTGRPLDASEFAVHLDQVRDLRAPLDYRDPARFFERTYLTENLAGLGAEALRRLSGECTETSSVFNLATQFGGGKTHALTMLYHLARGGSAADNYQGVRRLLDRAGLSTVPQAAVAVFVGTEFDSLAGRGGDDGTPHRQTPWGEIAWQLGGADGFQSVARHDAEFTEPKGDVIRAFLPRDRPALILMDEVLNYASTYRRYGYHDRLYNFIQALSETARGQHNVVLVVSIPASEMEYTTDDATDEQRFKKMLDRVGKAVIMSAETETSEIIRRRLFEWSGIPKDGRRTAESYAEWVVAHRNHLPGDFPFDSAQWAFEAAYPFHPAALSVFERKWRSLPRFQQTRGVLRLLALWVSRAYEQGFKGAHADPLIGLGTAPLDDALFRAAVFEQLGEGALEAAVTTDIAGKSDSHAVRLDAESVDVIRRARLHRKVATAVFFESNGGQLQSYATLPEIRLAVGEPELDLGHVETVLENLAPPNGAGYYVDAAKNRYWLSQRPNLNKVLADRRATIHADRVADAVRAEVHRLFAGPRPSGLDLVLFPARSGDIPDRPVLVLAVLAPEVNMQDPANALATVARMTSEAGTSARTFKSALIWLLAETTEPLRRAARDLLAWEDIRGEGDALHLDGGQRDQLDAFLAKSRGAVREAAWRSYRYVVLLGKDGQLRTIDLGLTTSSAADSLVALVVNRLRQDDEIVDSVSPQYLVRNWPGAFDAWPTRAVRDAFYASPIFPRLLRTDAVKDTIVTGVNRGDLAYVGKTADRYDPFVFRPEHPITAGDVEITDQMFVLTRETAESALSAVPAANGEEPTTVTGTPAAGGIAEGPLGFDGAGRHDAGAGAVAGGPDPGSARLVPAVDVTGGAATLPGQAISEMTWSGDVPPGKWMNLYTRLLTRFVNLPGLSLRLTVRVAPPGGLTQQKVDEARAALRELGLDDRVETMSGE
jgi:hypothetical protein